MTVPKNSHWHDPTVGPETLSRSGCYDTYERIAPFYDLLDGLWEFTWKKSLRPYAFEGLSGRILDAGIGTGLNMPFYPACCEVVGIDLSPAMLARARRRARKHKRCVKLLTMDLRDTEFPDRYFDSIVATFVFCTLTPRDRLAALREFRRICKPTGPIRVLDYCLSRHRPTRLVMRCFEPWLRWGFNGTFDTSIERFVEPAGLEIADSRFLIGDVVRLFVLRPAPAATDIRVGEPARRALLAGRAGLTPRPAPP